jgi:hypothetical protein
MPPGPVAGAGPDHDRDEIARLVDDEAVPAPPGDQNRGAGTWFHELGSAPCGGTQIQPGPACPGRPTRRHRDAARKSTVGSSTSGANTGPRTRRTGRRAPRPVNRLLVTATPRPPASR